MLTGKTAVVSGAASGIGAAIAEKLAASGANVVVNYLGDASAATALVDRIVARGGNALPVQADVANANDAQLLIETARDHFGGVDILVNNAGVEERYSFIDTPDDVWEKIIGVNLSGPFYCSRAAARLMIAQGRGGRIVNISSIHEDVTSPTNSPYCASKGGLRMLMRTIAVELAPHRITVNNIAPGATDTPIDAATKADPDLERRLLAEIPLGRWGQPSEIASLCYFLCGDEAAYITGTTIVIDGGMMRQATSL